MKLAHIAVAVKKINERIEVWQKIFGFNLKTTTEVADQKVKVAVLEGDGFHLELLEPLNEESSVDKFIKKRGEGLHHLCFEVEDLEGVLASLRSNNIELIDQKPRMGAVGKKIAFLHPRSMGGVLIELVQK
ncbi:MAG TPA: methylmalonyl-CoA epimerase [candidate division WOR-3 bacterium]|uniref:Methylmalonyl-CoA epimerase n=1 Tax=candidate division WOR-3 bacterium TaxID=2052148 RepID=A0A9C9EMK9_UNCW3|nr:methylmalonyl-CoA epimerase [candidate division WOR-3 bacterium]